MTTKSQRPLHKQQDTLIVNSDSSITCTCGFFYKSEPTFVQSVATAHLREMNLLPRG